jgi:Glycosyltransferase family 87
VFVDSPVSWDLRNANSNLVYLGVTLGAYGMLRRRPWLAGALVGLSISLKLYSGLLLVWLLVHGPRRALYAAAITIVLLWLLLPMALFGVDGTIRMYNGWHEQLKIISDPSIYSVLAAQGHGPPLVTLRRAAITLSGAGADAATTRSLLILLWAIWLAALLWYAGRAVIGCERVAAPSRAALADWTILMLAPLPFSPWLEPYHAVPLVPATILCLAMALDERLASRDRSIPLIALSVLLAIHLVGVPFQIRGLGLLAQFLVPVIAFGLLRPRLDRLPG